MKHAWAFGLATLLLPAAAAASTTITCPPAIGYHTIPDTLSRQDWSQGAYGTAFGPFWEAKIDSGWLVCVYSDYVSKKNFAFDIRKAIGTRKCKQRDATSFTCDP
jgi:hypothetical protein